MKNLPILVKFLGMLGAFGLFAVAATWFMALQMNAIAGWNAELAGTLGKASHEVGDAARALQEARAAMEWGQIAASPEQSALAQKEMQKAVQEFSASLGDAARILPEDAQGLKSLQVQGTELFNAECARAVKLAASAHGNANGADDANGESGAALRAAAQAEFNANCAPSIPQLSQAMQAERARLVSQSAQAAQKLKHAARRTLILSLGFVLGGLALVGIGIYFGASRMISKPLLRLRDAMARLSRGELDETIPDSARGDEIGQMARAVLVFKEAGQETRRAGEAARRAEAMAADERSQAEAQRKTASSAQALVVANLAGGLERLSAGDLINLIEQEFSEDYESLRANFNSTVKSLQSTMQQIAENAGNVMARAGEITQSADNLSRRTEQQAASLEQTAAALDEITATVRKASDGADEARNVVNAAKTDAERSGGVVSETMIAMGGIEDSSRQIASIIGVIDEIAFQTNLLALNAGVEAARAGDAGRGFAVVATEVRALAQRSADAAKEIKALINGSGAQVQAGVRLVNETGQALTRIAGQVARLNVLVTDIAASAQEQATALAEVNGAVNQMDQATQQNAAMVEESTAASHALVSEAQELMQLVGAFRIGIKTQKEQPKPVREASSSPLPRAALPVAAKPIPQAPSGRFVPVSPAGADDWDEF